jgi:hypothetical protein
MPYRGPKKQKNITSKYNDNVALGFVETRESGVDFIPINYLQKYTRILINSQFKSFAEIMKIEE